MIDALEEEWWPVAVAVTAALLDDPAASDAAAEAVAPVRDSWTAAARDSLAVPACTSPPNGTSRCARRVRPPRRRRRDHARHLVFLDRYVARGRCPADDRLDDQAAHASTVA